MTSKKKDFTVLGAGPAGLAVAYYAAKFGFDFKVFEAKERVGGNCVTFSDGKYRWDCGAHRPASGHEPECLVVGISLVFGGKAVDLDGFHVPEPGYRALGDKRQGPGKALDHLDHHGGAVRDQVVFDPFSIHDLAIEVAVAVFVAVLVFVCVGVSVG